MASDAPIVADLHAHTRVSDGTLEIESVPTVAKNAGLEWVAITDHDRIHPGLDAPVVAVDGVQLIRGIELRVETDGERYDLLGYGVEHTPALDAEIERLQANRKTRAAAIVSRVESRIDCELDLEITSGVGRPHIARAIADSAAPYDYKDAFTELIGRDRPCYVARDVTDRETGVELLSEACAVVGLAHPFRYDDLDEALEIAREVDALERYYPYGRPVDTERLDRVIEEETLLATGGSDAHERTLGEAGMTAAAFEPIREALEQQSVQALDD